MSNAAVTPFSAELVAAKRKRYARLSKPVLGTLFGYAGLVISALLYALATDMKDGLPMQVLMGNAAGLAVALVVGLEWKARAGWNWQAESRTDRLARLAVLCEISSATREFVGKVKLQGRTLTLLEVELLLMTYGNQVADELAARFTNCAEADCTI